jgi:serine/threonine-protein kinase
MFAIKMLLPELSQNPHVERMFMDEAGLAARIRHPHVAQVVDLGECSGVLYQVMEWVDGVSLFTLMRLGPRRFPVLVATRIIAQACAGLHAAHELRRDDGALLGLVHRDVSPQNILVTVDGITKVVDFGIAHFAGRAVAETGAGTIRGKVPYMAPEHALGELTDRRADVFALGTVLYQLLAGAHPFLADDDLVTLARVVSSDEAPRLRAQGVDVSAELEQVVASALVKERDARTATAGELMRALARAVPASALQSTDPAVGVFVQEHAGAHLEERTRQLRADLATLDEAPSGAAMVSRCEQAEDSGVRGILDDAVDEGTPRPAVVPRPRWAMSAIAIGLGVLTLAGAGWVLRGASRPPRLLHAGVFGPRLSMVASAYSRAIAADAATLPGPESIQPTDAAEPHAPASAEPASTPPKLGTSEPRSSGSPKRAPQRGEFTPGGI